MLKNRVFIIRHFDIYLTMRRDAWCKIYLSDTFVSRNLSENSLNFFKQRHTGLNSYLNIIYTFHELVRKL